MALSFRKKFIFNLNIKIRCSPYEDILTFIFEVAIKILLKNTYNISPLSRYLFENNDEFDEIELE